jgi:hypothetical protein
VFVRAQLIDREQSALHISDGNSGPIDVERGKLAGLDVCELANCHGSCRHGCSFKGRLLT